MFRTRDFLLLLTTVAFLVMAITYTAVERAKMIERADLVPYLTTSEISEVTASISMVEDTALSREERLEKLREKINDSALLSISGLVHEEPEPTNEVLNATTSDSVQIQPLLCSNYNQTFDPYWPVGQLEQFEAEGMRQYYLPSEEGSSGTSSNPASTRIILLALPQTFIPSTVHSCLPSDVVGVALDGSLIRNNEISLYSIFTNETLIGYALDGFPIYGKSENTLDDCGGRIELGQYRYELNDERSTILNCFSGTPQEFLR